MEKTESNSSARYRTIALVLFVIGLFTVIELHLVAALIAGLLVFQLVHGTSQALRIPYLSNENLKLLLIALLATVLVIALVLAGMAVSTLLRQGPDNLALLLNKLASVIEEMRVHLPASLAEHIAPDAESTKNVLANWAREHAAEIRSFGADTVKAAAHVLIGFVVGAMAAMAESRTREHLSPFQLALSERAHLFADAFRRILLAQLPISAINTVLTAIYLMLVLPALGIHLPFAKTLIAITFFAGLLPVVGNLISNTAILLVSLSVSFAVAAGSLLYLVVIHKLEYFLNARIVGAKVNARAWELLIVMVVAEAAFGLPGLVLAPVLYAYAKAELAKANMIVEPAE